MSGRGAEHGWSWSRAWVVMEQSMSGEPGGRIPPTGTYKKLPARNGQELLATHPPIDANKLLESWPFRVMETVRSRPGSI